MKDFLKLLFPRLGIVYTPIEIVDFILHSAESILRQEFKTSISDKDVHVIDPFTGTGTFITRLLQSGLIKPKDLEYKYFNEIHANEIILLAYYIGAINIEATYSDQKKSEYVPFPGIILTDTFQMFEADDALDLEVFKANSSRAELQKATPIKVIIGNPPYSIGQTQANDNNQNVTYPDLDASIRETYAAKSSASTMKSMYDSYIRAFRWATNRIVEEGLVCFVSNGGFIDTKAADGFRRSLIEEFSSVYVLNLRGDIRGAIKSGGRTAARAEGGNVFGQGSTTPVAITILVKNSRRKSDGYIHYFDIGDSLDTSTKLLELHKFHDMKSVPWEQITPNEHADWINLRSDLYGTFLPLGDKRRKGLEGETIFNDYSSGLATSKDSWVYNFSEKELRINAKKLVDNFNSCVDRVKNGEISIEDARKLPKSEISWDQGLLKKLENGKKIEFVNEDIQLAQYRPFSRRYSYRNNDAIWSQYRTRHLFPNDEQNIAIATSSIASFSFHALAIKNLFDYNMLTGDAYPLYMFSDVSDLGTSEGTFDFEATSGPIRKDGISNWALNLFQTTYRDKTISKKDIFCYVYGVFSSPEFIQRFQNDARKSGPRLPLTKDFWTFSKLGSQLVELHSNYENLEPEKNIKVSIKSANINDEELYKVEKMKFGKNKDGSKDLTKIIYNDHIEILDIPIEAHEFGISGRSAIEWFVDQYKVTFDKDTLITNDPNSFNSSSRYIFDELLKVIAMSIKTKNILSSFPALNIRID
jgi:predicted helicase